MPVQIEQNSYIRCEKSPGTCPFFTAAPECGPSYQVGGLFSVARRKDRCSYVAFSSVRLSVIRSSDQALTE